MEKTYKYLICEERSVVIFRDGQLTVARMAPKKTIHQRPFWVWTALAKATPQRRSALENPQAALTRQTTDD